MSTQASKKAYNNAENKVRRESHKEKIFRLMKTNKHLLTNRQIAEQTGLTYEQVHKRTSELVNENKLFIACTTIENGQTVSVYLYNCLEPAEIAVKKLSLKEWLKYHYPEILNEFIDEN